MNERPDIKINFELRKNGNCEQDSNGHFNDKNAGRWRYGQPRLIPFKPKNIQRHIFWVTVTILDVEKLPYFADFGLVAQKNYKGIYEGKVAFAE